MLRVSELSTIAELEAIGVQWHELALSSHHPTPYMLPAFLVPWIRRLSGAWTCRVAVVWDRDEMVGLAAMMERRIGGTLLGLRMLCSPEVAPSPPFELLARPGHEARVASALLSHWNADPRWDAIEMTSIPEGAASAKSLMEEARRLGMTTRERGDLRFFYIATAGGDWKGYHAALSRKFRKTLRRGWRYFEGIGVTRVLWYPGDMDLRAARETTRSVIAKSWKDDDGNQGWNRFADEILDGFDALGVLRASFLTVDDVPVAYIHEVTWKGNVFGVQNGYDLAMQAGSPGQLLLGESIRRAMESGAGRYVTGNRDYLRQWGEDTFDTVRIRIRRRSPVSAARLALYDYIHHRRQLEALRAADAAKDVRKRIVRTEGADPDDEE